MGILRKLFGLPDIKMLEEKINSGALLLDVRTKEEYKAGHVRGSINIPITQIASEFNRLSKEKPIVAVCESGARSAQVVRFLKNNGYQAYNGGRWVTFKSVKPIKD